MPMVIYTIFASVQDYVFWSCTSKYSCWRQTLTDVRHLPFPPTSTKIPFRTLRRVARRVKEVLVTKSCPTLCDPTVAHQVPLCTGFSRQEYWGGLPFPLPGESSWSRDQTRVSCIAGRFFTIWATGKSQKVTWLNWGEPPTLAQMCYFLTSIVSRQD